VVADEVSKLAERSSTSAKEIETLIQESVVNVTTGVERATGSKQSMEEITAAAQLTSDMTTNLSASMQQQVIAVGELSKVLENVTAMSTDISTATAEQSVNAPPGLISVENVNELTQQAATSTEEISASAQELAGMAQQLHGLTASFKVSRDGYAGSLELK